MIDSSAPRASARVRTTKRDETNSKGARNLLCASCTRMRPHSGLEPCRQSQARGNLYLTTDRLAGKGGPVALSSVGVLGATRFPHHRLSDTDASRCRHPPRREAEKNQGAQERSARRSIPTPHGREFSAPPHRLISAPPHLTPYAQQQTRRAMDARHRTRAIPFPAHHAQPCASHTSDANC